MKKSIKIAGVSLLVIVAVPLIVALFVKKEYAVEREIIISKPKQEVFDYVKYLKNQDNYSVWSKMDPDMQKAFVGTDATVGFISKWNSNKEDVGVGEQEIIKIKEGEQIDFELRFIEPFEAKDYAYMKTLPVTDAETKVKWGFNGKMNYPMNCMLLFMDMEEMLGGDLEKGLINLKAVLEK